MPAGGVAADGTGSSALTDAITAAGGAGGSSTSGSSGATSGGMGTASAGDDSSGVGSGGTGISTADATSVGAVDGLGSIIVNDVRFDIGSATVNLADVGALQIGMSVEVTGTVDASMATGIAHRVTSASDLRGPVNSVDPAGGTFVVMGTTVTVDDATVWADMNGVADLVPGTMVQIWGLPDVPGVLLATRVQRAAAGAAPVVVGTVQQLDVVRGTFILGSLSVAYRAASFVGGINAITLANGAIVRVRAAAQPVAGLLVATQVESWYPVPRTTGAPVQLEGVITNYTALGSFQVLGMNVDASAAKITGGQASNIGHGVKVAVSGTVVNGVLVATQLKIRHIPGGGVLPSFTLIGTIGNYVSPASFRVQGQLVDASAPGVVFVNGTQANLGNGVKVTVSGAQVVDGRLVASQVTFN
jgi:hypothetical protein